MKQNFISVFCNIKSFLEHLKFNKLTDTSVNELHSFFFIAFILMFVIRDRIKEF